MDNIELFEYIVDRCEKKGLTIKQLAKDAAISRQTIYNLKECRIDNFSTDVARKLAKVLGCPAEVLMRIDKQGIAAAGQPVPDRREITIYGDFKIIPLDDGLCRLVVKDFCLSQKEQEAMVKRFLFHTSEASDEDLQKVADYAANLFSRTPKSSDR